jgi:preprotein translocase subunit SecD
VGARRLNRGRRAIALVIVGLMTAGCAASADVAVGGRGGSGFFVAPIASSRPADVCEERELASSDGGTCYLVGPAAVDGGDVLRAVPGSREPATTWDVTVTFTAAGLAAFETLAAECVERTDRCPDREVAIVVNGEVVLAPALMTAELDSPDIVITGPIPVGFDQAAATALADQLTPTVE